LLDEVRRNSIGRVIALSHAYSNDDLIAAVRRAAIELRRTPRQVEYAELREAGIAALAAAPAPDGATSILPSIVVLKKRWGAWPNVIAAAGLPPLQNDRHPRARRHPRRPLYTKEQLLEAVRQAWIACGEPLTRDAYSTWRDRERRAAESRGEHCDSIRDRQDSRRVSSFGLGRCRRGKWPTHGPPEEREEILREIERMLRETDLKQGTQR
jgi:hypothetical protein